MNVLELKGLEREKYIREKARRRVEKKLINRLRLKNEK